MSAIPDSVPPHLELQHHEYKKAFSYCRRNETLKPDGSVRQRAGCTRYLSTETSARIAVAYGAGCPAPTACWTWKHVSGTDGHHRIEIHPQLTRFFFTEAANTSLRRIALAKSVLAHEVCHGLYTSRDAKATAAEAARWGVPFRLLNLFEDVRIETRYVRARGKAEKFNWRLLNDYAHPISDALSSPMTWLFTAKEREPALFKTLSSVMAPFRKRWSGVAKITAPSVPYMHPLKATEGVTCVTVNLLNAFLGAILNADTTAALIPIAAYWIAMFGKEDERHLPPIILHTIPTKIGDEVDPASTDAPPPPAAPPDGDHATRGIDHSAVDALVGGMIPGGRGVTEVERVMHYNTDQFLHDRRIPGFAPLSQYTFR